MTDTHSLLLAIDPVILLLSLGVVAVVATRHIGLSPIVGYLAIGLALRAAGHTIFRNSITIEILSELGVVFLLFDIGLHFSFAGKWFSCCTVAYSIGYLYCQYGFA